MDFRKYFLLFMVCFSNSAFAADEKPMVNGQPFLAEGARGRYTLEQAQVLALQRLPGTVLASETIRLNNKRIYQVYTIQTADTSVYRVRVDAITGEIDQIDVETFAPGSIPPEQLIPLEQAKTTALSHEQGKSVLKPELKDIRLSVFEKRFVYEVVIKRLSKTYMILVNAYNGAVISDKELDQ